MTFLLIRYFKEKNPYRIEIVKIPGLNEENKSNFNYKYGYALTTEQFLQAVNSVELCISRITNLELY